MHGGERCGAGSVKTAVFKVLTAARSHSRFGKATGGGRGRGAGGDFDRIGIGDGSLREGAGAAERPGREGAGR